MGQGEALSHRLPRISGTPELPGIFEATIFSPHRMIVSRSAYIRAMHPKTQISSSRASVEKVLKMGWVGQMKIHGHRAQIHLSADESEEAIAYNRQGKIHRRLLPPEIIKELRRVFDLKKEWTVIDAEWIKPENKLYLFDILKLDGKSLYRMTYGDRWKLLPRAYISPYIQTLPILRSVDKCMEILNRPEDYIEGLVFKSETAKGFDDSSIVRCRKAPQRS
jgi:ATP-dependent DNA ligase